MATKLRHIAISVKDPEAAAVFFEQANIIFSLLKYRIKTII